MTAQKFEAGRYTRANEPKQKESEGFCDRVTTTEGQTPQSRSRLVSSPGLDNKPTGNIHRDTVQEFVPHDVDHAPWSTAHRNADLGQLKSHQQQMLSKRQKTKNRRSKGQQV